MTVVMKFGGSSVVDAAAIDRVCAIVGAQRAAGNVPVVVVSALGGVTDALLALAASARLGDSATVGAGLEALSRRHHDQARALGVGGDTVLRDALDRQVESLGSTLADIRASAEDHDARLDAVAAVGEILSSRLVAAAMAQRGLAAAWVDARDLVITDDRFTRAAPLMDDIAAAAQTSVQPLVSAGTIPVLGGFVGRTVDGHTTTLGRGGSDYSASVVGAAIHAVEIQIWTDVDGMLTADPRIVADAEVVPHLSFAEAAELAYFGAKVLHPSTIFPAISRNIPVRILNTMRPDQPILTVRGLHKRFGSLVVAADVNLDVHPYRLHSLIGPNGAGKTTFFNMLTGLLRADAGQIMFDGHDITQLPVHRRIRLGLGRSFQILSVFRNLTTFENVRVAVQARSAQQNSLWRDAYAIEEINARTWSLLAAVGLEDRAAEPCANL